MHSAQLTASRYWGCGLGFAVLFITLIDLMHRNLAPTFATRIPRVRWACFHSFHSALLYALLLHTKHPPLRLVSLLYLLCLSCLFSLFSIPLDPSPYPLRPLLPLPGPR